MTARLYRFFMLSIIILVLWSLSFTVLSWYTIRGSGKSEFSGTTGSATTQWGLITRYSASSFDGERQSDREWMKWDDFRSTFDEERYGDEGDFYWVPIISMLILLGLLVTALALSGMALKGSELNPRLPLLILAISICAVSAFTGVYYFIRWGDTLGASLSDDEFDISFIDHEEYYGLSIWSYPSLGWFFMTLVVPVLAVMMAHSAKGMSYSTSSGPTGPRRGTPAYRGPGSQLGSQLPTSHLGLKRTRPLFGTDGQFSENGNYGPGTSGQEGTASPSSAPLPPSGQPPPAATDMPASTSSALPDEQPLLTATIACPGCTHQFEIPATGQLQTVTCPACNLTGQVEV